MTHSISDIKKEPIKGTPEDHQKGIENHKKIANHLETAAKHHHEAAKHHEAGDHDKAAKSTITAQGHHLLASQAQKEDAKEHALKG